MSKNNNLCNNCGKQGHLFHQCKLPITSYGVIVCRRNGQETQFLMIRRKDSFGYIDFMRGKYSLYNMDQIQNSIDEMSVFEKERLLTESFDNLWKLLWGENCGIQYRNEELISCKKFETLKSGVLINNEIITLADLVSRSKTRWCETEWEFPKGRRNYQEKDLDCALREFEEETGYCKKNISVVENILPFEEIFIGTNHKSYKHKYFLAFTEDNTDLLNGYQASEVSKLEWKSLAECLDAIRPYNLEKKQLILNINKVLQEYRLY
jgi:8-oxo-dGTP pyrophosphatase MutT (NUDIX family)